ncbi:MAG TPA: site-specific integrase, partial [Oceanipulchritudo sp.]|nr:site-specific integrase [Oceanipulchritudo sp.]
VLREVRPEWRLVVVLGFFAGLRPEQVAPAKSRGKVGLDRSAIDDDDGVIYVSKAVSKTRAHCVPLSDCLRSWLDWAGWMPGQIGKCHKGERSMSGARETKRLGDLMNKAFKRDEGWPHDWLRHSYGSHRNAVVRNLAQVSEEMGTSPKMMDDHYHQPRPKEMGEAYFALRPSDLDEGKVVRDAFSA